MPENLWKLSVTYLFEYTDFPIGGLQHRFCNFATLLTRLEKEIVLRRIKEKPARYVSHEEFLSHCISNSFVPPGFTLHWTSAVDMNQDLSDKCWKIQRDALIKLMEFTKDACIMKIRELMDEISFKETRPTPILSTIPIYTRT